MHRQRGELDRYDLSMDREGRRGARVEFLEPERRILNALMPGFDAKLLALGFASLETPGSPGLAAFQAFGGCGLGVPTRHGGAGAGLGAMVRVLRAIGSRSPSLVMNAYMHCCAMTALAQVQDGESLLADVVTRRRLLSCSLGGCLDPPVHLYSRPCIGCPPADLILSGAKLLCSTSRFIDSVVITVRTQEHRHDARPLGLTLLSLATRELRAGTPGHVMLFGGAEIATAHFEGTIVPRSAIHEFNNHIDVDALAVILHVLSQLLSAAAYLGVVSGLVERTLSMHRLRNPGGMAAASHTEAAMRSLEALAETLESETGDTANPDSLLSNSSQVFYFVQDAILEAHARSLDGLEEADYWSDPAYATCVVALQGILLRRLPPVRGVGAFDRYRVVQPPLHDLY